MRLVPISLEIQGFRSFNHKQVFQFADSAGLGLISGNIGAGKSSIWAALFWCLYGKSDRKLASPHLHNWKKEEAMEVKFNFMLGDKIESISRTWKPINTITWTVNEESRQLKQEELEAFLGMGPEVFLQGVLVSQFGRRFLELDPAEKQAFLMTLLRVERWDAYKDAAKKEYDLISLKINELETKLLVSGQQEKKLEREYQEYAGKARDWEVDKNTRLKVVNETINEKKVEHEGFTNSLNSLKFEISDVNDLHRSMKGFEVERQFVQVKLDSINLHVGQHQGVLKSHMGNKQKLTHLAAQGYLCPTCGQKADASHIAAENAKISVEIQEVTDAIDALAKEKGKLSTTFTQLGIKITTLQGKIREVDQAKILHDKSIAKFKAFIESAALQIKQLNEQRDAINLETNQWEILMRTKINELRELHEEIGKLTSTVTSMKSKRGIYDFWKNGFKEIQLFLLAEVTTQLERAYNSSLAALGMKDWKLKVLVENATKSGSIQNKFNIQVYPPQQAEPVQLEAWSGGETESLKLACTFGTLDLIRQLSSIAWDLECFDEPGQFLSKTEFANLFVILKQRAMLLGKQIYITDHRMLQNESYDFHRHVINTPTGSIIENSN